MKCGDYMNCYLSERIAVLRRERGLTQEQLGQLVGVSAQAVSKWEKGGAPDVELLPTLADRLGVTIDTLFGRGDEDAPLDMAQQMSRWLQTIPKEERLMRLFRMLANSHLSIYFDPQNLNPASELKMMSENCYAADLLPDQRSTWFRSMMSSDEGMLLGVLAENLPIYLLMPEPPEGYEVHFASNEDYRKLFSALSLEGSLELLRYLYAQKPNYYTIPAMAKRTGLPQDVVETAACAMTECNLLRHKSLELEEGTMDVYMIHDNYVLVPFLYFARWFMEKDDAWYYGWDIRERPILELTEEQTQRKKEKQHETQL